MLISPKREYWEKCESYRIRMAVRKKYGLNQKMIA